MGIGEKGYRLRGAGMENRRWEEGDTGPVGPVGIERFGAAGVTDKPDSSHHIEMSGWRDPDPKKSRFADSDQRRRLTKHEKRPSLSEPSLLSSEQHLKGVPAAVPIAVHHKRLAVPFHLHAVELVRRLSGHRALRRVARVAQILVAAMHRFSAGDLDVPEAVSPESLRCSCRRLVDPVGACPAAPRLEAL